MEYLDFSTFGTIADTDYLPLSEAFDNNYNADSCTKWPNHLVSAFSDFGSCFDLPVSSVELLTLSAPVINATPPASVSMLVPDETPHDPTKNSAPSSEPEYFSSGLFFIPAHDPFDTSISPASHQSPQSLYDDALQELQAPNSPKPSPRFSAKRRSTDPAPMRPKRGRPRLDRDSPETSSASSNCQRESRRLHNEVERKYRNGLNAELERLRCSIPTLPQSEDGNVIRQPKLSKAMILSAAISYIKVLEQERDMYREENERQRSLEYGL